MPEFQPIIVQISHATLSTESRGHTLWISAGLPSRVPYITDILSDFVSIANRIFLLRSRKYWWGESLLEAKVHRIVMPSRTSFLSLFGNLERLR
jgi:hypothetical protein